MSFLWRAVAFQSLLASLVTTASILPGTLAQRSTRTQVQLYVTAEMHF